MEPTRISSFAPDRVINSFAQFSGLRVGIIGGSFDPPHTGHLHSASLAQKNYDLDVVVFIPANKNPLKTRGPIATNEQRLEMLSLLIEGADDFYISTMDQDREGSSYLVDTLTTIWDELGQGELFFICGADQLESGSHELAHWRDKDRLFDLTKFIISARGDFKRNDIEQLDPAKYSAEQRKALLDGYMQEKPNLISSTKIRELLALGNGVDSAFPDTIYDLSLIHI